MSAILTFQFIRWFDEEFHCKFLQWIYDAFQRWITEVVPSRIHSIDAREFLHKLLVDLLWEENVSLENPYKWSNGNSPSSWTKSCSKSTFGISNGNFIEKSFVDLFFKEVIPHFPRHFFKFLGLNWSFFLSFSLDISSVIPSAMPLLDQRFLCKFLWISFEISFRFLLKMPFFAIILSRPFTRDF